MDTGSIPAASTESLDHVPTQIAPGAGKGAGELLDLTPGVEPVPDVAGVYAIVGVSGWIKIGRALNIASRVAGLQGASPVELRLIAVLSLDSRDEARIHGQYAHLRGVGEWFRVDEELLLFACMRREHPDECVHDVMHHVRRQFIDARASELLGDAPYLPRDWARAVARAEREHPAFIHWRAAHRARRRTLARTATRGRM